MAEMIVSFSVMLDCCHLESCSFLKGNIRGIDLGERGGVEMLRGVEGRKLCLGYIV